MQGNREKYIQGYKDNTHANAVLDLSMPDRLSLPHVTALSEQIITSAMGQFAERL